MMGMVLKDFMVLRKQIGYYLIFLVVYGAMTVAGVSSFILPVLIVLMGMMLPISAVGYDDLARWDSYAVSTPAGRRGVVAGRYLFALICIALSSAVVLALMLALSQLGLMAEGSPGEIVGSILGCAGMTLLIDAVILPVLLRFGAERARTIYMVLFVAIFGGSMFLLWALKQNVDLPSIPGWLLGALPVVLGLAAVGGFIISYFVAQGIYAKKEL